MSTEPGYSSLAKMKNWKSVLVQLAAVAFIIWLFGGPLGHLVRDNQNQNFETTQTTVLQQAGFTRVVVQSPPWQDGPQTAQANAGAYCPVKLTWATIGNAPSGWVLVKETPTRPIYEVTTASALSKKPGVCR